MTDQNKSPPPTVVLVGTGAEALRLLNSLAPEPQPKRVLDDVEQVPDLTGSLGRAWRVDLDAYLNNHRASGPRGAFAADHDATVVGWIVEASYAHPIWHSYLISLSHLRPVEGVPAPTLAFPGATHQFWLFAIDPGAKRSLAIAGALAGPDTYSWLTPVNFAAQLSCVDDIAAKCEIERAVVDIIGGRLNPDTDFTDQWVARFGGALLRKEPLWGG